jgi:hypothetical protein
VIFVTKAGLPDGIFGYQKSNFWFILEGLEVEILSYFTAIWCIIHIAI